MAVRYLPERKRMGHRPAQGITRPMRRIHPAGLYEAVCPADTLSGCASEGPASPPLLSPGTRKAGPPATTRSA
jgi:hypothetical protein